MSAAEQCAAAAHNGGVSAQPALRAVGWRVLVRLPEEKKKTDSGIYMPDELAGREQLAVILGEVMSIGEHCYPVSKYPAGPWCRTGDWVIFRSYTGTRLTFRGREYRLLADDAIEGVTTVPDEIGRA